MSESVITQCPHCSTSFRVNDAQLGAANGAVRCGTCLKVFNALQHRSEEHTSELQSPEAISYAVFCLKKIFFNDTATTEIYTGEDTLSLHDALPIFRFPTTDVQQVVENILQLKLSYLDRKSTRLNSSHLKLSRMPSSA